MNGKTLLRRVLRSILTGGDAYVLKRKVPPLKARFEKTASLGLYLHIPFCRQICPYCPYNKQLFHPEMARRYAEAVMQEVDAYAKLLGDVPITSFYIGGGTPTTMLDCGLKEILEHIYRTLNMQCGIHMESHPNDLTPSNLEAIHSMGVDYLSIGVEALFDHHLQLLHRPYTAEQARAAVARAVETGFSCVNADFIFDLPHQTIEEVGSTAKELIALGVDQVAAYPLFTFPYTRWFALSKENNHPRKGIIWRRRMMLAIEKAFLHAGFDRSSVWAFTRRGKPKYCSVTVPRYIGLGASGASYLEDVLYFNTFNVDAYIAACESRKLPIGLSMELSRSMQMAGWLYWRVYEVRFRKSDFRRRFGMGFDQVYGLYKKILATLGFLSEMGDEIVLNSRGAYWLHVLQDLFSLSYVSKLWSISKQNPWPNEVVL